MIATWKVATMYEYCTVVMCRSVISVCAATPSVLRVRLLMIAPSISRAIIHQRSPLMRIRALHPIAESSLPHGGEDLAAARPGARDQFQAEALPRVLVEFLLVALAAHAVPPDLA